MCNCLLGIFSPFRHELPEYKGYDITKLKDNVRFLEVILNRGGSVGGLVGLFFDGATCNWVELPKPDDRTSMSKMYSYVESLRKNTKNIKSVCMMLISKLVDRFNNYK